MWTMHNMWTMQRSQVHAAYEQSVGENGPFYFSAVFRWI